MIFCFGFHQTYDDYNQQFISSQYARESESIPEFLQHYEKQSRIPLEQFDNNVEDAPKIIEIPEPLPEPQKLGSDKMYKKSGPEPYRMYIDHLFASFECKFVFLTHHLHFQI